MPKNVHSWELYGISKDTFQGSGKLVLQPGSNRQARPAILSQELPVEDLVPEELCPPGRRRDLGTLLLQRLSSSRGR